MWSAATASLETGRCHGRLCMRKNYTCCYKCMARQLYVTGKHIIHPRIKQCIYRIKAIASIWIVLMYMYIYLYMYANIKMSQLSIEGELDIIAMRVTVTDQDFPSLRDHLQQIDPSLWKWILFSKGDGIRFEVQAHFRYINAVSCLWFWFL